MVAVASMSGCSMLGKQEAPVISTGPLEPVLKEAKSLLASYETVIAEKADLADALSGLRDDHSAHVETLAKILGQDAKGKADPIDGDLAGDAVASLRDAESSAYDSALEACVNTTAEYSVLLGEITACRASHVDALGALDG